MQTKQRTTTEVNLKDMFFHILYHWRSIILITVICAVALGGYQWYSIKRVHDVGGLTSEEEGYNWQMELFEANRKKSQEQINNFEKLLEARTNYRDESLLLKLDPVKSWVAVRVFSVHLDKNVLESLPAGNYSDPVDSLLPVYAGVTFNLKNADELKEVFGTDNDAYIREVVGVATEVKEDTVKLTCSAPTQEEAVRWADYMTKQIEKMKPEAEKLFAHDLILIRDEVYTVIRQDIANLSNNVSQEIENYQSSLNVARLNASKGAPGLPGTHIKKMAFFGAIFGLVLTLLFYGIQYAISGKLHESKDLITRFQLPIYGDFAHSRARRPGKVPDSWIEAWEFRNKVRDPEAVKNTLAALLREKVPSGTLLLTGTLPTSKLEPLCESLKERIEDGPEISCRGNLNGDSETLKAISKADAVVLVEEQHVSVMKEINREAELLNISDANVIGFVTL